MNKNSSKKHMSSKELSNLSIDPPKTIQKIHKKKKSPQFKLSTQKIIHRCNTDISLIKSFQQRSEYSSLPKHMIKLSLDKRNPSTSKNSKVLALSKYENDYYPELKTQQKKLKSSYSSTIKSNQISKCEETYPKKQTFISKNEINRCVSAVSEDQYKLSELLIKKAESTLQKYKERLLDLLKKNVKLQKEYKMVKNKLHSKNLKKSIIC